MKRAVLLLLISSTLALTACADKNASMYKVNKVQEVTVVEAPSIKVGRESKEVTDADGADKDTELGTKHVIIVDGVAYAELDGKGQSGSNDTYTTGNNIENNRNNESEKVGNAIDEIFKTEETEEKTEDTSKNQEQQTQKQEYQFSDTIIKFRDICNSKGMLYETAFEADYIRDLLNKYNIKLDSKDKARELCIAYSVENENLILYEIVTYGSQEEAETAYALNNKLIQQSGAKAIDVANQKSIFELTNGRGKDEVVQSIYINSVSDKANGIYFLMLGYFNKDSSKAAETYSNILNEM